MTYGDDTPAGTLAGSAYVFVRSGAAWTPQAKLADPDGAPDDWFGYSVAVDGDTAVVGAQADDTPAGIDAGSAYVFVRSGTIWSPQAKLTAPDGASSEFFGTSVALDGDTAAVGASWDDTPAGQNAGSAHVFVRSGTAWTHRAQLTAPDGSGGDEFGTAVALDGAPGWWGRPTTTPRLGPAPGRPGSIGDRAAWLSRQSRGSSFRQVGVDEKDLPASPLNALR